MYYHLTYFRDFLDRNLPIWTMELVVGLYDNEATPIEIAQKNNMACLNAEQFRVYQSPSKKMSKKSKLLNYG
jgi:hypothetical protein